MSGGSVRIAVASRHGATAEIAEAIAKELRAHGHTAAVVNAEECDGFADADAVVLGSAVYMGRWMKSARELVDEHAEELSGRPVWLFSSGPIGEPPKPEEEAENVAEAVAATGAREHMIFNGRLDPGILTRRERLVVRALKVPTGDFRDWESIREWARSIAADLEGPG